MTQQPLDCVTDAIETVLIFSGDLDLPASAIRTLAGECAQAAVDALEKS